MTYAGKCFFMNPVLQGSTAGVVAIIFVAFDQVVDYPVLVVVSQEVPRDFFVQLWDAIIDLCMHAT